MKTLITLAALGALALAGCDNAADTAAGETEALAAETGDAPAEPATAVAPERGKRRGGFAERMKQFDTDGDGKLDETERAAMRASRAAAMFERLDADGDGGISQAEVDGAGRRGKRMLGDFAAVDADGDGAISKAELEKAMSERRGRRGVRGRRSKRGPGAAGATP